MKEINNKTKGKNKTKKNMENAQNQVFLWKKPIKL
jgi:hypothetical protein